MMSAPHQPGSLQTGSLQTGRLPHRSSSRIPALASTEAHAGTRTYRLIDLCQQPHPHLDGLYETLEDALRDAIRWLEGLGPAAASTPVGLEVSTRCGSWRTIRHPDLLLCPLPGLR